MSPIPDIGHGGSRASDESTGPSGERLLAAIAQDRDREAFRLLFDAYAPRIKQFVCARGAAEALAEEVVQEVMLKVWHKASLFDPAKSAAGTWIHAIARHCMLDRLRGERRAEIEDDDPNRVPPTPPDEDMALAEGRAALTRAMHELPPAEVEVLHAAYFEDLSMREIAERRALPLGTVKTRTRNGLERLRSLVRRNTP